MGSPGIPRTDDGRPDPRRLAAGAPVDGPLLDTFDRVADDLRISVTDRCNFRCTYCMPAEGLAWLPRAEILSFEEIARLVAVFASLGVQAVKLTGGEPTVRNNLPTLVRMVRNAGPDLELSMTTNGILLDRLAEPLARAGLDRVTVSCDSLLRHRFAEMTRRDALDRVLAGVDAARTADLTPIKVNCVVIDGTNDDEAVGFAELARRTGAEVRFIEFMPLDADQRWSGDRVVPSAVLRAGIEAVFPLRAAGGTTPQPAQVYGFADGAPGSVGFVSSVTDPFCDTCNRIRITADGQFRSCLFAMEETDLRGPMRSGAEDRDLETLIRTAVAGKWAGHRIGRADFVRPGRSMSMIGG
jgi:GTP 3',8-cyclase